MKIILILRASKLRKENFLFSKYFINQDFRSFREIFLKNFKFTIIYQFALPYLN